MKRNKIKRLRREEYARVAFQTLGEYGYSGTTVDRVAKQAGVSKTNILHYFGNKTQLLEMALRYGNSVLVDEVKALLIRSNTPWERVCSIILANFSAATFEPKLAHAWLSLCAEVPYYTGFQRVQTVIHARMRSNLVHALRQITDPERAESSALQIAVAIDGLWLRLGLQLGGITRSAALSHMETLMGALFPGDEGRVAAWKRIADIQEILSPS